MKTLIVMIFDPDKMPDLLWKSMWHEKSSLYAAKINEESYDKVTKAVDDIQEKELLKKD